VCVREREREREQNVEMNDVYFLVH
jgi:hypothetical protein